jgi:hypothetical protein
MTAIAQRVNPRLNVPSWTGLLWGLALLGLLLLPSDYRAGAEAAHGHALMQLWIDAADGTVHHHHASDARVATQGANRDWLDPAVDDPTAPEMGAAAAAHPDVGEHQDASPAAGGLHFQIQAVALLVLATARSVPPLAPYRMPKSRVTRVLLPPPRWTPLVG